MREKKGITAGELALCSFVALFSPLIRGVPKGSLEATGQGAWLCPLVALVPALGMVWLLRAGTVRGGGLGGLLVRGYGQVLGRVLCMVEGVWLLVELSLCIRLYGERFISSVYGDTSILLFLLTLAALTFWQSEKPLGAVMRLAKVGFVPMMVAVAAILLLGLGEMKGENWLPLAWSDSAGVVAGAVPVLSVFGLALVGFFLGDEVRPGRDRSPYGWAVLFSLTASAMAVVVLGVFGVRLTGRLQVPLFSLAKELSLGSVLARLEAFVVALWVVSDLLLAILLQRALCRVVADGGGVREPGELALPVLVAAVFGSLLCGSREEGVLHLAESWLSGARLILIYGVPMGAYLLDLYQMRKKRKKLEKRG